MLGKIRHKNEKTQNTCERTGASTGTPPLVVPCDFDSMLDLKSESPIRQNKPQGNYIDSFVKSMFGQTLVFTDFLKNYAAPKFVAVNNCKR